MAVTAGKVFKYGCFGCLGLIAIVVIIFLVVIGLARSRAKSEILQTSVFTQELPATPPLDQPLDQPLDLSTGGIVIIDLSGGEFEIVPGPSGEPIQVEATFDEKRCDFSEGYTEGDGPGWTYKVDFHCDGAPLLDLLKVVLFSAKQSTIKITLPEDTPIGLDMKLRQGGGAAQLGGLWLTTANIDVSQGGFELDIDSPLHAPLERMSITSEMGGFAASSIGNASPRILEVDHRMGGLMLDLSGAWAQDADITLASSMAGGLVMLPKGVQLIGVPGGSFGSATSPEIDLPKLTFSVTSEMGELEFQRR
jgi:hypothetical protein